MAVADFVVGRIAFVVCFFNFKIILVWRREGLEYKEMLNCHHYEPYDLQLTYKATPITTWLMVVLLMLT